MKKILIFPAGTEIAFEILNALKYTKFLKIYGGTSISDHSEFVFENLIKDIPFVNEPDFISRLNEVIDERGIDCIYPAHDSVCMFLSEHLSEIHAKVIITEYNTVKICRSKAATYKFFEKEKFIPKIYSSANMIEEYPVFVKPEIGQGSEGVQKIDSQDELLDILDKKETLVICEYLPGIECTVDCFTDRFGKLRVIKLRSRERIRDGISVRSQQLDMNNEVKNIAETINQKLKFRGAWFFQIKQNIYGKYRLMEISPRIPGTIGLSRNLGINFALLTLYDFWGYDIDIIDNDYEISLDRAFYSAYRIKLQYDHIYIDYDDTLVINGKVNADLMKFLYQQKNKKKKIYLLSKHSGDIYKDLKKNSISELLFEKVMVIPKNKEKKNYIKEQNAIFIDDSFRERKEVYMEWGIPVFDLDMVESLIEWRI